MSNGFYICASCGQPLSSLTAFGMRHVGRHTAGLWKSDRSITVAEMERNGMRMNEHDTWTTGREFVKVATAA
jgi:hypothetical protein